MSIETTLDKLAAALRDISIPRAAKVYAGPRETVDIGSFPCVILSLDPDTPHMWRMAAHGLARHDYTIACWVFVGPRTGNGPPLPELHARCLPWAEPVGAALYASLTLDETVTFIGDGTSDQLITYTIGSHEWAGSQFFGLKFSLPVTEKISVPMSP